MERRDAVRINGSAAGWCFRGHTHIAGGQPINSVKLKPTPLSERDDLELEIPQSVLRIA